MSSRRKPKPKPKPEAAPGLPELTEEQAVEVLLAAGFTRTEIDDPAALRRFACRMAQGAGLAHRAFKAAVGRYLAMRDMYVDATILVEKLDLDLWKVRAEAEALEIDLDLAAGLITRRGAKERGARLRERLEREGPPKSHFDTTAETGGGEDGAAERQTMAHVEQRLRAERYKPLKKITP